MIETASDAADASERLLEPGTRKLLATLVTTLGTGLDALRESRAALQASLDDGGLPELRAPGGDRSCRDLPAVFPDLRVKLAAALAAPALEAARASRARAIVVDLARCLPGRGTALAAQESLAATLEKADRQGPPVVIGLRPLMQPEPELLARGRPVPAGCADLALCMARYGRELAAGPGMHLRLAGIESADEAGLWVAAIDTAVDELGLDPGSVTVTVAIDTLAGAFGAAEILRALHERAIAIAVDAPASLRSFLRAFRRNPRAVLPDSAELTGNAHFQRSLGRHVVRLARAQGALALAPEVAPPEGGGERERRRITGVLERAVRDGFDGVVVGDAALVDDAAEVFRRLLPGGRRPRETRIDTRVTSADLLQPPTGKITEAGIRANLELALAGFAATRAGRAVLELGSRYRSAPEIDLAADQLWQWVRHETGVLDDGRIVDESLFRQLLDDLEPPGDAAGALSRHVLDQDGPGDFLAAAANAVD